MPNMLFMADTFLLLQRDPFVTIFYGEIYNINLCKCALCCCWIVYISCAPAMWSKAGLVFLLCVC